MAKGKNHPTFMYGRCIITTYIHLVLAYVLLFSTARNQFFNQADHLIAPTPLTKYMIQSQS